MMMAFWIVLIALVVLIVVSYLPGQGRGTPSRTTSAEEILAERFARGEIDEEELNRLRESLRT